MRIPYPVLVRPVRITGVGVRRKSHQFHPVESQAFQLGAYGVEIDRMLRIGADRVSPRPDGSALAHAVRTSGEPN